MTTVEERALPRPPYDPELLPMLEAAAQQGLPSSITPEMIAPMRETGNDGWAPPIEELIADRPIVHTERTVPGPAGAPDIILSILTPAEPLAAAPAIYHTHGGGMIIGNRHDGVAGFLDLIEQHKLVLVSVEYRLAPEHPDPAPVEDCYAGLVWTAEHADELGIDPSRLIIGGASAGGGLAAGVTLLARDRGGPALAGQLLLCPMLDDRNITVSSRQYQGIGVWDRTSNKTGWDALLGEGHESRDVSVYAAPARADDLRNLPPAFIDVGSAEVFRDEDIDYASRIWAAGGQAELHVWAGGFHGFQLMGGQAAVSVSARGAAEDWIRRTLSL
ncbi:esterase [Microlunatus endophyticus]|uniref:Esterase n=1 Tax=Microlunatus endophyticus TaxID=1716077 RepID=A0A917S0H3_9ACTN|nr:alpha/beta hydrolase [Microlunatus endophyticus]GGL46923.1 esterase [Microlunatus endophyticus]